MHLVTVAKLSAALVKMLNLVKACVLNFGQKAFLKTTTLNLASLTTKSMHFANVLLKCLRH